MRYLRIFCLVMGVFSAGCGGKGNYVPVSGKVMLNGKPLAETSVIFQPINRKTGKPGMGSSAKTDAQGNYTLVVMGQSAKGASPGLHQVVISQIQLPPGTKGENDPPQKELLPARFNNETTLTFEVPTSGTNAANFDLKDP